MRSSLSLALAALVLAAASCAAGVDPKTRTDAGYSALQQKDFDVARDEFDAALEAIGDDEGHGYYLKAKLGRVEALAALDPGQANRELAALADAMPQKIDDGDYYAIGGRMIDEDKLSEAVELLTAGMERFPDSENLPRLRDRAGKRAEEQGDAGVLDSLRGLGYVGGK